MEDKKLYQGSAVQTGSVTVKVTHDQKEQKESRHILKPSEVKTEKKVVCG